ncbi:MAG TPA: PH domain-containing protein [Streptosporangiaceae bacterium]
MANDGTLSQDERSVLELHPHWKTVLGPMVLLVITVAAALTGIILIPAGTAAKWERLAIGVVAIAILLRWVLVPILRWRTTTYQLTNRRLRLREGILSRKGRDFPLIRISDVSFQHGLIDRLLGCGRLVVESSGEHGQLVLTEIPGVERVQATLFQLVEDEHSRLSGEEHTQP